MNGGLGPTEESVYKYALRVAYLAFLTEVKAKPKSAPASTSSSKLSAEPASSKRASLYGAQNLAFNAFDMFKDDKKSHKIPKELVKVLRDRLEKITNGRDQTYQDPYFMKELKIFHQALQQSSFRQQFKSSNSKIEDIVLIFLRTSQVELKKAQLPPNVTWQSKLTDHVSMFVGILKECLKTKECQSPATPDLLARLEIYQTKMSSTPTPSGGSGGSANASSGQSIEDMDMVLVVQSIFGISTSQLQKDLNSLKKECTVQKAFEDLRNIINQVNRGSPFPARREDFDTDDAYDKWKVIEIKTIRDLMATMALTNPEVLKDTPTDHVSTLLDSKPPSGSKRTNFAETETRQPYQNYNPQYPHQPSYQSYNQPPYYQQPPYHQQPPFHQQSQYPYNQYPQHNYGAQRPTYPYNQPPQSHPPYNQPPTQPSHGLKDQSSSSESFTFIPQNPRSYYKLLMNKCIEYELQHGSPEERSIKILSKDKIGLLNECALRWRVSPGFRWLQYLDVIRSRFDNEDPQINLDHIKEGMHLLKDAIKHRDVSTWTISDKREHVEVFSGIHDTLLNYMKEALEHVFKIKPTEFDPIIFLLNTIYESELFKAHYPDVSPFYNDLRECVRKAAFDEYRSKVGKLFGQESSSNEVQRFADISRWILQEIDKLKQKYPKSLVGQLDIARLVIEKQAPLLLLDMDGSAAEIVSKVKMTSGDGIPIDDVIELYREILELKYVYEELCPGTKFSFGIEGWFGPYIKKWLNSTDSKTPEWVHAAISADEFKPVSITDTHSSSVVDLFTSFNQTVDFVKRLNWPNQEQSARFMTILSQTIGKALEQYCNVIEDLFMKDMTVVPAEQETAKQSTWYLRAKNALYIEKTVPSDIQPKSCVKMNNIEAAAEQLDKLYESMNVDNLSGIMNESESKTPLSEKIAKNKYLYTIKIVSADNLTAQDVNGLSDPYCVLTDEKNQILAQTRVQYETLNPRWDEAFDITLEFNEQDLRKILVTVWDKDQVGSDDICGKQYIYLDRRYFADSRPNDVYLDLDPQGRVLLRVSMEDEKDDPRFYFGKAFRTLKRARDEMTRTIVDRISPFLKQCLSRDVINKLLKPVGFAGIFEQKKRDLTDRNIEEAIDPLFDYFDENLMILNTHLHPEVFKSVISRIWKEIVTTIELVIIPPLSDRPSDMKALSDNELMIALKWLQFLKQYLHAEGQAVSSDILENQKYKEISKIDKLYNMDAENLMQEYLNNQIIGSLDTKKSTLRASKSVLHQRNLGTIKKRKSEKRQKNERQDNGEIILRILRMRAGNKTKTFLKQQVEERLKKSTTNAFKENSAVSSLKPVQEN
ncbi:c2 domain protein [Gigaspora margarita]|uniref:C2 domain protein n=1 Tax=Gigaspora margarita TaxID=4874 RepID=A0A8H3XHG4_GIGMA|nr:c2 domain protein [Gigaspora margarita]